VPLEEADHQDNDVAIISRNPLQGKLLLITDEIQLHLEEDSAEALMSALSAFLMEGAVGPL